MANANCPGAIEQGIDHREAGDMRRRPRDHEGDNPAQQGFPLFDLKVEVIPIANSLRIQLHVTRLVGKVDCFTQGGNNITELQILRGGR